MTGAQRGIYLPGRAGICGLIQGLKSIARASQPDAFPHWCVPPTC